MNKSGLLLPAAAAFAALAFAACSGDDTPDMPTPVTGLEIVTVDKPDYPAMLTMQRTEYTEPVAMTVNAAFPEDIVAGQRVLIQYSVALADTARRPMPVSIAGYAKIPYGKVEAVSPEAIARLAPSRAVPLSVWTTGDYVNMQVTLDYDGRPRSLSMAADAASLDADTLRLHLFNPGEEISDACVGRRTYASFDISGVRRPGQPVKIYR